MQAQHIRGYYDQRASGPGLLAADGRQLRRAGPVRHPRDELRHQRAPAPARHLPQLVRVHRRRPRSSATPIADPRRHRVRPGPARRDDGGAGAASSSQHAGSVAVGLLPVRHHSGRRTTSRSTSASTTSTWTRCSSACTLIEFHMMYARAGGRRPAHPAAARRAATTSSASGSSGSRPALTADSPQVDAWIRFAERNGGSMPDFPLPLGDPIGALRRGDIVTVTHARRAADRPVRGRLHGGGCPLHRRRAGLLRPRRARIDRRGRRITASPRSTPAAPRPTR